MTDYIEQNATPEVELLDAIEEAPSANAESVVDAEETTAESVVDAEETIADAPAEETESNIEAAVDGFASEVAPDAEEADIDDADEPVTASAFAHLGLSADALTAVGKLGYEAPSPVQEQAIPVVLEGRDLIAAAATGTGKTAAFLLPLLSNLARAGRGKRPPRVLVVTPTRELAQQIAFTCIKIARATGHFATTVYGGTPYGPQIREIRGGTDILIATPGRLCDLMKREVVDLSHIEALVLDEADRMLDMGFLPDVTTIVEALPTERQTLLFSATIDQSIEKNLGSLLRDPVMVEIAHRGETAATVEQFIMPIAYKKKQELLEAVLNEKGHERVIVFARTKIRCEECAKALVDAGFTADSIHSDKPQGKRRRVLADFRKGRTGVLVATDVLARGIDVPSVDYVINLDLPDMPEDYVHRIGRTGRAGEEGYAISFVSANSRRVLHEIEDLIGREIPVMELETYDIDRSILEKGKKKRPAKSGSGNRAAADYRGWHGKSGDEQRDGQRSSQRKSAGQRNATAPANANGVRAFGERKNREERLVEDDARRRDKHSDRRFADKQRESERKGGGKRKNEGRFAESDGDLRTQGERRFDDNRRGNKRSQAGKGRTGRRDDRRNEDRFSDGEFKGGKGPKSRGGKREFGREFGGKRGFDRKGGSSRDGAKRFDKKARRFDDEGREGSRRFDRDGEQRFGRDGRGGRTGGNGFQGKGRGGSFRSADRSFAEGAARKKGGASFAGKGRGKSAGRHGADANGARAFGEQRKKGRINKKHRGR